MAFVIVSGYDDFSYCREALRLQITDYILKPVNYEEFGSCIDRLKISLYNNEVKEKPVVKKERVITGITKYMQEHLSEDVSLHILSEEFHLNSQYISQLFKNEIGKFSDIPYKHSDGARKKTAAFDFTFNCGSFRAVWLW